MDAFRQGGTQGKRRIMKHGTMDGLPSRIAVETNPARPSVTLMNGGRFEVNGGVTICDIGKSDIGQRTPASDAVATFQKDHSMLLGTCNRFNPGVGSCITAWGCTPCPPPPDPAPAGP